MDQYLAIPGAHATGDLSALQYQAVYLTEDFGVSGITNSNAAAFAQSGIGILQDDPAQDGEPASVAMLGICKARAGGTIVQGAYLTLDNDGKVISGALESDLASADRAIIGRALGDAADGDIVTIAVNFITPLPHDTEA
jgi:hypothetical protein